MLVKVTHDRQSVEIRWWPKGMEEPFNEWSIYKDVDPRAFSVRDALIRGPKPQSLTAKSAGCYVSMLDRAARMALQLDEAITSPAEFRSIEVLEIDWPDDNVTRIAHIHKRKGEVTISIPRQEE